MGRSRVQCDVLGAEWKYLRKRDGRGAKVLYKAVLCGQRIS
jgi:hypothetical protein